MNKLRSFSRVDILMVKIVFRMTCNNNIPLIASVLVVLIGAIFTQSLPPFDDLSSPTPSRRMSLCERCKLLTQSFQTGLDRTSRGKFEGGDTHWEENKLKTYAYSEIRLVEIEEQLCKDLPSDKDQCHALAEEYESEIEKWWFGAHRSSSISLYDYLCFDVMKACCIDGHFGADCKPCNGFPDNVCSRRGYCLGNGTREGSGKCRCFDGYGGTVCDKCDKKYYEKSDNENELLCAKCDASCADSCRAGGPKGCLVCKSGYLWDQNHGCVDIDECVELGVDPCESNTFCINTEGSFQCYQCDPSCDGCNGDGPDSCLKCAKNHALKDGVCVDLTVNKRDLHISLARYATYLGLCVATCIIFRNNIYIASIIGLVVAAYITVSEFTLKDDQFNPFGNWVTNMINT